MINVCLPKILESELVFMREVSAFHVEDTLERYLFLLFRDMGNAGLNLRFSNKGIRFLLLKVIKPRHSLKKIIFSDDILQWLNKKQL